MIYSFLLSSALPVFTICYYYFEAANLLEEGIRAEATIIERGFSKTARSSFGKNHSHLLMIDGQEYRIALSNKYDEGDVLNVIYEADDVQTIIVVEPGDTAWDVFDKGRFNGIFRFVCIPSALLFFVCCFMFLRPSKGALIDEVA